MNDIRELKVTTLNNKVVDITHSEYDCKFEKISSDDLRRRIVDYVNDEPKSFLWSDEHPEESSSRVYVVFFQNQTVVCYTEKLDELIYFAKLSLSIIYSVDVEDNLV